MNEMLPNEALTGTGDHVAYFGYGSLVNRATLRTQIVSAVPARLLGWRRRWRPRPDMPGFPAALLTVEAAEGEGCDGLLVFDRPENLAAVDEREARYRRVDIDRAAIETKAALPDNFKAYVYVAQEELPPHPEPAAILQSYLDAVMQGFLIEHGEKGLCRFMRETASFETPVLRDRAKPRYPRSVTLAEEEREMFDRLLAEIGARFRDA
ncbi:MAG: gamma-glutamylcyclotransferase [Rhizobiaceae bacterium]|nr:gamma-glutamylcyclotransferase [Rhizobiaceae bacterium]